MLKARNLILLAAGVLVVSILGSLLSMLQPRDSGGRGRDSYGTRAEGYRALYEMLAELGVRVKRELSPPQPKKLDQQTLLLLGPHGRLIRTGPKYVQALLDWIEQGGRLVVAPPAHVAWLDAAHRFGESQSTPRDLFEVLKLDDQLSLASVEGRDEDSWSEESDGVRFDDIWSSKKQAEPPPRLVEVRLGGSLQPLESDVSQLAIPADGVAALESVEPPHGALTYRNDAGDDRLLLAVVERGKGEIVVLSDPRLWSNRLLAQADNSVLAAHLIAPRGESAVFDEFYHGLSVRGNVLYLLTLPGFAAVSLALLAVIGVWAWRSAMFLGPPLPDPQYSRRDVREYVEAMASFFERGRNAAPFLVHEVRDGVLRQLSQELKLPAETPEIETIVTALRRQNPQRASKLAATIADLDARLAAGGPSKAQLVLLMQRLVSCL